MERVQVLIDRLQEQQQRGESAAQLLLTVQLLQQELLSQQQQSTVSNPKKIAVVMPTAAVRFEEAPAATPVMKEPEQKAQPPVGSVPKPEPTAAEIPFAEKPAIAEAPKVITTAAATTQATPTQESITPSYSLRRPSITELMQEKGEQKEAAPVAPPPPTPQPYFNVLEETPTLLQHTPQEEKKIHQEVNQIIHGEQQSLNDQLKQQKTEVAHLLQDTPVKDLRKAIGINDKFVFLAELFNGDEAMYERSIKTINNFHVLQEAEYWINRELKLRLGWNDTKGSVQQFYKLVRRRFS